MRYPYSTVREGIIQVSTKWTFFKIFISSESCCPLWLKCIAQFIVSLIDHNILNI